MQNLENYKNTEIIYESSNSIIYRGLKKGTNEPVIIKLLNKEYSTHNDIQKYCKEFDMISLLKGKASLKLFDQCKIDGEPVLIMEDIGGQSLHRILKSKKLDIKEFLELSIDITEIIGEIHKNNIIHKDINPSNIIWNIEKNIVKIIDFGISTELPYEKTSLKNLNVLEGTLSYISPEQTGRMNKSLDYRSDFYSLGVTFYFMLTGKVPFETKDTLEMVHCHIAVIPPAPHEIDHKVPKGLSDIVMKLMSKNEEDRYQSAHGLKYDLEHCLDDFKKNGSIKAFRLASTDVSDRFIISQKLYGRENETEKLLSAFKRVSEDNSELVLVSGFTGIGKSFLINEIQKPIVEYNGYFLSGKFERLKRDVPFSGFIQALTSFARQILSEEKTIIEKWKEKILKALGPNGKIITDIIPFFEHIIGKQKEIPLLDPNETQNRFNMVFQNFIKSLTSKENPLVIFLDDAQWADRASLKLLKLFSTDTELKHLLLICSFRHNELHDSHIFTITLDEINKSGTIVNNIFLETLKTEHVCALVSDTLNQPMDDMIPLAEILIHKTNGNPFFLNEFLKHLHKEKLFKFSIEKGWEFNLEEIKKTRATDNVVQLMAAKIKDLPHESQEIIKIASCIGNYFNTDILKIISGKSEDHIHHSLKKILQEGMINKIEDKYKFNHDRILESAYSLIPDEKKKELHYKIGNFELEKISNEELGKKIFYIVNHLNLSIELYKSKGKKTDLARLNLLAGNRALESNAYDSSLGYLKKGIELLEKNSWEERYNFTLNIYQDAAAAAQLSANYKEMEKLVTIVLQNARTILDAVKVYRVKIFGLVSQHKLLEAVSTGTTALNKLGFKVKENPGMVRIAYELILAKIYFIRKTIEDLIHLPELQNKQVHAIFEIMSSIGRAAYFASPNLVPIICFFGLRKSIKYGRSIISNYIYTGLAIITCGLFENIDTGYRWGQLALNSVEKYDLKKIKSTVWSMVQYLINHWKLPLRNTFEPLLESYKIGIETGDMEAASTSLNFYTGNKFIAGVGLIELEKEIVTYAKVINKLNQDTILNFQKIQHQTVLNLMGKNKNPCMLVGQVYDENIMLLIFKNVNNISAIFSTYIYSLLLCYTFENYEKAYEKILLIYPHLKTQISWSIIPVIYLYDSLTQIALYPKRKWLARKKILSVVRKNQKKMRKWAFHSPINYSHKYHLVEAELAQILGKNDRAIKHYDEAIKLAHENRFLNEEALCLELTAKFWIKENVEDIAKQYMTKAFHAYSTWGAIAKVKQINKKYGHLVNTNKAADIINVETATSTSTSGSTTSDTIDLTTIIKTSQTLSSEIDPALLLNDIMKYSIENAGAQRGFLILQNEHDKNLYIEAKSETGKEIKVLESIPIENHGGLSIAIVNFVNRTGESIVLNNAMTEGDFTDDPYIIENKIKSLLCIPIIHKEEKSGILYLENNLSANTFTLERLKLLKILSSQAAISIENVQLLIHRENSAKLEKEMEIAANIQSGLIVENPKIKDYEVLAYLQPSEELGGDYFDFINVGGKDWLVIGDASGRGVTAGLIMMMVQTAIHTVLTQNPHLKPSQLLNIINKVIRENLNKLQEDRYMPIIVFAMQENGQFTFSGLHQNILVFRKSTNEVESINSDGVWIGLMNNIKNMLKDKTVHMEQGDVILLFTDGIIEAWEKGSIKDKRNPNTQMFSEKKLINSLLKNGAKPLAEIKTNIFNELENYDYKDDITIIMARKL